MMSTRQKSYVKTLSERENYLKTVEFKGPEWIPVNFGLLPAVWKKYGEQLEEIILRHPLIFGKYGKTNRNFDEYNPLLHNREGEYYRDDWRCLWYNAQEGILGRVIEHPLTDWRKLDSFQPPDPMLKKDWNSIKEKIDKDGRKGLLKQGGPVDWVNDDCFFDRLHYLRGFENLMIDLMTDPPELHKLIELVLENNMRFIHNWLEIGIDVMYLHSDIGTQRGLMMSPKVFRKYLKPVYKEMFMTCRRAGTHVHYSSDGCLLEIIDDLIECGVSIHDPQVGANTLEGIVKGYKGKEICAMVDLDQQMFPFWRPRDIREHIREVVKKMGSPRGGLMINVDLSSDVPLKNIEAICLSLEEFCFH